MKGPNRGIPNQLASRNSRVAVISSALVPDVDSVAAMYRANGGQLTSVSAFGTDPLADSRELLLRRHLMEHNIPSPDLFSWTVNGLSQPFADSVKYMIDVTTDLERYL